MPVKLRPEFFGMKSHFERLCKDRIQKTEPGLPRSREPGDVDLPVSMEWAAAAWLSAAQGQHIALEVWGKGCQAAAATWCPLQPFHVRRTWPKTVVRPGHNSSSSADRITPLKILCLACNDKITEQTRCRFGDWETS